MGATEFAKELTSQGTYQDSRRSQTFRFKIYEGKFRMLHAHQTIGVNWLVGSGQHAQTPIATNSAGTEGVEIRLSAFGTDRTIGLTPHHDRFDSFRAASEECFGRPMDVADVRSCLGCHSTVIPPKELPLDSAVMISNVGCERCHGPRKSHAILAKSGRADEVKPMIGWEDPEQYMRTCSACHRDETTVRAETPESDRVRFQPYGLKRSKCYLESETPITCSTCHDPHDAVSLDRDVYVAQCQECHQPTSSARCTSRPRGDCVECHMPRVQWTGEIAFHDHYIRVHDAGDDAEDPSRIVQSADASPARQP
ncbi:multiheme c-type cytochrome [Planctomycetes bacterium K23_9]